jgi:serine protease Do
MKYLRRVLVLAILLAWSGTAVSQTIPQDVLHHPLLAAGTGVAVKLSQAASPDVLRNGAKILQVFRAVVAKPSEATVRVLVDGKEVAFGTIVGPDGWILTKWSEIKDTLKDNTSSITCKLKDGRVLEARIVGVKDEDTKDVKGSYDLAMLKVEAKGLPTVEWGNSKEARVGRWVASAGIGVNPVAVGVVSVANRKFATNDQGPSFDTVKAGYLGVGNLTESMGGAKVGSFPKEGPSPAENAGVKVNDIIYEISGRRIVDTESLINIIGRFRPGDKILLKVKRGEEQKEIEVTLGKRPKKLQQGNPQERMGTELSKRRGGFPAIIQHDSGIRPQDCGGPLVDLDGKTIGINIARAGRTESYAIPAEHILTLLPDLKSGKLAPSDDPPPNPNILLRSLSSLNPKDSTDKRLPGRFVKVQEVKLSAGATYAIDLTSGDFDAYLVLEDAGKKIAEDNDSGGDRNARIIFRAPRDGTYRILITSFNAHETGSYTLTVRKQVDEKEKK